MSSQPPDEIIHIIFTYNDVDEIADELGVPIETARERAGEWARSISDTATSLISEQLTSVIEHNTP